MEAPDSGELSLERLEAFVAGGEDPDLERRLETDARLRERVERLRDDNDLLGELGEALRTGESGPSVIDELIEGYQIKREIYRGGQGIVLEAYQEHTKRSVAVKLMLDGALAADSDKARFDREVELAAQLRHPNVVTVHESGLTRNGRRYIAMELVDGVRLDEAWRAIAGGGSPTTGAQCDEIVRLFLPICDAIAYAHRLGVIHRDLKPGNVLVTDEGRPVVLDFGIAKLAGAGEGTTRTGDFVGTLSYAAPEQIARSPDLIDTRADIYALGVMLYESLTGRRPGATGEMSLADSIRAVTERDAPRASSINPAVSRDLDAILRRALERDPARRYQSASSLRDELKRALAGEVVRAREGERLYLASRFLRRRRVPIAVGGALAVLAVIAGVQAFRASVRAAEARGASAGLSLALKFVEQFEFETREAAPGEVEEVPKMLEFISTNVEPQLGDFPAQEADVRTSLGLAFLGKREFSSAERELRDVVRLQEARGAGRGELAQAYLNLGRVLWFRAEYEEAEQTYRRALSLYSEVHPRDSLDLARATQHLASTLLALGKFKESEPLWAEALRMRRTLRPPSHPDIASTLLGYGWFLHEAGRNEEAETLLRESLGILQSGEERNDWRVARVEHALAVCLAELGQESRAEQMFRDALAVKESHTDPKAESQTALELAALLLRVKGPTEEGRALCARAEELVGRIVEPEHPDMAKVDLVRAEYMLADGDPEGALRLARDVRGRLSDRLGVGHWNVARAEVVIGRALRALGEADGAEASGRRAAEILGDQRPDGDRLLSEARALAEGS